MHRTSGRILLIAAAFALFLVPVAAIAAGGFTDVDEDNVFKADIQWMKDAGVTKGCNPPTNDKFCPEANVTREQMSAFMHRLAVNRVVDAGTVEGYTAAELMASGGTAGPAGPAGPVGPVGADGTDGADGAVGPAGPAGADGTDGTDGTDGVKGDKGDPGTNGTDGQDGADGADGISGLHRAVLIKIYDNVKVNDHLFATVSCPAGEMVTGGGGSVSVRENTAMVESFPLSQETGWQVSWMVTKNTSRIEVETYAMCVHVP